MVQELRGNKIVSNEYTKALDAFDRVLEEQANRFFEAVSAGKQDNEFPAVMLRRACDLAQKTLKAVKMHLLAGHGAFLACTLCRPFYEIAFKLLWAARQEHGWDRLSIWLANEDKKWAQDAFGIPEFSGHAKQISEHRDQVLHLTDGQGQVLREPPNLKKMLYEIEDCDIKSGLRRGGGKQAVFEYVGIYRILCRPAHAHLGAAVNLSTEAFLPVVIFACGNATFALVRAMIHLGARDPEKEIRVLANEFRTTFSEFVPSLTKT